MAKMYYFSARKHAHDIEFRYDRTKNIIWDLEEKGKPVYDGLYELQQNLSEILHYCVGCIPVVQLPSNLYRIAIESVQWATEQRSR